MIKIMSFSFYFKLPAQRTYRTIASCNYIGSDVFHSFRLNALASTTAIDIYKRNLKEKSESTISTRQSFYLVLGVVAILCKCRVPYSKPNPTGKHRRFHILRNGTGNFLGRITSNSSKPKPSLQCPGQPNHHFLYTTSILFSLSQIVI
jgi:hypothetical protein